MGLGSAMAGGNPAAERGRQVHDKYPTPPDVTRALVNTMQLRGFDIWEPCAGDGAMSDVLQAAGNDMLMSDIAPGRADIIARDFFDYDALPEGIDWIVTNPPFNLAERIIRHAFKIGCRNLALVLKSTYWHAASRAELFWHHRPSMIMPLSWRPDFMNLGRPTMECQWCVWEENAVGTSYFPLQRSN